VRSPTTALFDQTVDLSPVKPFSAFSMIEYEVAPENLRLVVLDAAGHELIACQPAKPRGAPMPKPVEKPKSPKDYATPDELYFTGQRIEQLFSPSFEARPYYEEMLRRDPGDYRANTALGILLCKQWRWAEAAKHLSNAVARATANHIRPKDGEAFYYLGVALMAQERLDEALIAFSQVSWNGGWRPVSLCAMGAIEWARTNYDRALAYADQARPQAWSLPLVIAFTRRMGDADSSLETAQRWLPFEPLNRRLANELHLGLLSKAHEADAERLYSELTSRMDREVQGYLELATEYANAHLWFEAFDVLWRYHLSSADKGPVNPMVYYSSAFYWDKLNRKDRAQLFWEWAAQASPDHCFPHRFEEEPILRRAMEVNPKDANAAYLLGCLLYDNQPENAIKAWEESRRRDDKFALTHRNLALAYAQHEKNIPKAIASLEKAVELNPNEARFFYELDLQYEAAGTPVARRLEMLTKHHDTVAGRDDALTREIVLLTVAGRPERALALLRGRHFRNWEGSSQIHNVYVDACLARGQQLAAEKKSREALAAYQAALEYPENLEVGRARRSPRAAQIQYLIGTAHEALGDAPAAKAAFDQAAAGRDRGATEGSYFHGLALQKLGRAEEARPIFERLVKAGEEQLSKGEAADYFAKFGEKTSERVRKANAHYLIGLGQLGLGEKAKAEAEFKQALALHPAHLGATMVSRGWVPVIQ
jgi:tetratricopeptide (TPR) repeat protein